MNKNNYCIIMAGGFGSRFWPVCTPNRPKQFEDVLATGKSMLEATFARFERICPRENIIIVTGELYADRVRHLIKGLLPYQVLSEPNRRNTAPCVAYAASVISEMNRSANVVVAPSDHVVFDEEAFVNDVELGISAARQYKSIVTLGIHPTAPNTKYGYIQFKEDTDAKPPLPQDVYRVATFTEKPSYEMARVLVDSNEFLWNTGIFIWPMQVLKKAYKDYLPNIYKSFFKLKADTPAREVEDTYIHSDAISIDFGIMEKADNVLVVKASFQWSDVETWDSLFAVSKKAKQLKGAENSDAGNNAFVSAGIVKQYDVTNTIVHLPANKNVVIQGLDNYIVAGDENTILICRRDHEELIDRYASDIEIENLKRKYNARSGVK